MLTKLPEWKFGEKRFFFSLESKISKKWNESNLLEDWGLIKKISLMQLFFKNKIYILVIGSAYTFRYYSHCSVALRARSKICKICERDYHTILTILFVWAIFISRHDSSIFLIFAHFSFLATYRFLRTNENLFPPRLSQTISMDISFDFWKNSTRKQMDGLIKLNFRGETPVENPLFNAFPTRSKSRISAELQRVITRTLNQQSLFIPVRIVVCD